MSAREKLLQKFSSRWKEIQLDGETVLVKLITLKEVKEIEEREKSGSDWIFEHISNVFVDATDHQPIFSLEFLKDSVSGVKIKELNDIFWEHNGVSKQKN